MTDKNLEPAGKLLIVVDDEPMLLEMIQALLECDGYEVRAFGSPVEALQCVQLLSAAPSLLLTDFMMEPINGIELITECRKVFPQLKSILFSGQAKVQDFASSPVQPDLFFRKPFVPKDFLSSVRRLSES